MPNEEPTQHKPKVYFELYKDHAEQLFEHLKSEFENNQVVSEVESAYAHLTAKIGQALGRLPEVHPQILDQMPVKQEVLYTFDPTVGPGLKEFQLSKYRIPENKRALYTYGGLTLTISAYPQFEVYTGPVEPVPVETTPTA
jgi:hypothetical protein